ncbi:MAG: c-type cytochrome domain-containing protein [Planctomycetaceae bacterium]
MVRLPRNRSALAIHRPNSSREATGPRAGAIEPAPVIATLILVSISAITRGADPPTFEGQVAPIFREKCCGCHNADKKKGGLDLTAYGATMAGGSSGEVIAPGDADGSYLWQLVSHASEPKMPPESDKLASDSLEVIRQWIAAGAIEKSGGRPVKPKAPIALAQGAVAGPEGPPVSPPRLPLEVVTVGARPTTITSLAASPHGEVVAVGGRRQVLLHHPGSLELIGVVPWPEGVVRVLRFTRDGKLLLVAGGEGAKSGRVVVWDVAGATRVAEVGEEFDEVLAADLAPDRRLVALGGPAKVVRLLATADGKVAGQMKRHTDWVTAVAFSPDGKFLASGDRSGNLFLTEPCGVRDAGTLKGHTGPVTAVAWRADGGVLASASGDGSVRLWDPKQAAQVKTWQAHGGGVESLAWLADGRLVTTGRDARAKLWKVDGAIERELPPLADIGTRVAVTADGGRILVGDWSGAVTAFATADGAKAGVLDTNPPRLEVRIQRAEASRAEVAAVEQAAAEKARVAAEALAAAESQVAAAHKAMDEAAAEFDAANARQAEAAKAVERWKAELEFAKPKGR